MTLAAARARLEMATYQALIRLSQERTSRKACQVSWWIVCNLQISERRTTRRYSKSCLSGFNGSGYIVPVFFALQIVLMEYRSPLRDNASTFLVPVGAG